MNGKDIFKGLQYVGNDLIELAEFGAFSASAEKEDKPRRKIHRPFLLAALIALLLMLVGCAVVYVLKMENVKIGEGTEQRDYSLVDGVYVEDPHTINTSTLTLAGVKGSNAYKACADFYAFQSEYIANGEKMAEEGTVPEGYWDAYAKVIDDKALELANQYGLKPEGALLNFRTTRNLCDALGVERFVRDSQEISADIDAGRYYENGNFELTMGFHFPEDMGYEVLNTAGRLRWNRQDCFSRDYVTIVDNGDWVERNYTTSSGSNVLILQSPSQERGYIVCDRGDALMTLQLDVNIELLSEDQGVVSAEYQHMTDKQIEMVADTIDFSIQPRILTQADVDAQAEIPHEATQNGYTLRLKSVETDGYVVRILIGVTAPEGTVIPMEGNLIFANYIEELTPANGSVTEVGGTTETIDDGDGRDNTADLLLARYCTMADGSAPFAMGTTWNLHIVDVVYSDWDGATNRIIEDTLAEGEWHFSITIDESCANYREIELLSAPIALKASTGWGQDGTDRLEAFPVTSVKLRSQSISLTADTGGKGYPDFFCFNGATAYVVMKDGSRMAILNQEFEKPIDLDQVDYVLFADGTKLPVPEE